MLPDLQASALETSSSTMETGCLERGLLVPAICVLRNHCQAHQGGGGGGGVKQGYSPRVPKLLRGPMRHLFLPCGLHLHAVFLFFAFPALSGLNE